MTTFLFLREECGPGDASPGHFCFLIAFISTVCTKQKCYEKSSFNASRPPFLNKHFAISENMRIFAVRK